jgi:hypothetical protein
MILRVQWQESPVLLPALVEQIYAEQGFLHGCTHGDQFLLTSFCRTYALRI